MKNRNLLTNIFSVILMLSLVAFLLVTFNVLKKYETVITYISLPLAILSVACIDIIFPIIDNIKRLRTEKVLLILTIVKIVLFIAAFVVMLLYVTRVIETETTVLIIFVVLYFAQFFINIDPKEDRTKEIEDFEEEEESEESEESEDNDTDDSNVEKKDE